MRKRAIDLVSTNHGTIIAIAAQSTRGRRWLAAHVTGGKAGAVDCDHRFGVDILHGALDAGLVLQDSATGRTATR